jgi:UDP-N-acetylmuramate--alanine ligase
MHIKDFIGKRVHMIGIGGSSMSGLAEMLKKQGIIVTGSDSSESHTAKKLRLMDIPVAIGHHPEIIEGSSLVVFSAAIHEDDPERMQAEKLNIPQMERAELLGQLMQNFKERICVCGTHGKPQRAPCCRSCF